ncbi:MAG: J domain-containing protein [Candidatus Solibacter usitatus]|nr:J domain-containing protein [Candidatus Solibacter usitatus]
MPDISPKADFYQILQVAPNSDLPEIQRSFRSLAQRYHPDNKSTGNDTIYHLLLRAYNTLSDPEQRSAYEALRKKGGKPDATTLKLAEEKLSSRGTAVTQPSDAVSGLAALSSVAQDSSTTQPAAVKATCGVDRALERRKREAILGALCDRRMAKPAQPGMNVRELERVTGFTPEEMEFAIWYLKESGDLRPGDNGRYEVSAQGVDRFDSYAS